MQLSFSGAIALITNSWLGHLCELLGDDFYFFETLYKFINLHPIVKPIVILTVIIFLIFIFKINIYEINR